MKSKLWAALGLTRPDQPGLQKITISLLVVLLCLSTGCARIVTGTHRKVTFRSQPEGAHLTVVNEDGQTVAEGTTPFTVKLRKGKTYFDGQRYTLTFSKSGFCETEQKVKSSFNRWYLGNLLFGGLIGLLVVDPLTGAMYTLPKEISVSLHPKPVAQSEETELRVTHLLDIPVSLRPQLIRID